MNERNFKTPAKENTEVKANKQQEKKYQYQGSLNMHPGQKLWAYRFSNGDITPVDLKDEKNYTWGERDGTRVKKLYMDPDCLYVTAINKENAVKKVLKKFGWKVDKAGNPIGDFPTVKLEDQVVELNKPEQKHESETLLNPERKTPAEAVVVEMEFPTAPLTKDQAIEAMQQGKKVTHRFFFDGEYVYMKDGRIHCEKDYDIHAEFWQLRNNTAWETDWEIYKP
jgi:hypothetical protein